MKCDRIITKHMELDDYLVVPFSIRFHLLFCDKCKKEVAILNMALKNIKKFSPYDMHRDMTDQIM